MQDPCNYFKENDLFNMDRLIAYCEHHSVYIIQSERFPNLVMLKYQDECQYDNKWSSFSRTCRGLVVDMKNQVILVHPYEKFFNLGQMPETSYEILKDKEQFEISEKLDGSLCLSFVNPSDNKVYLTTSGSFDSEHGQYATQLFRNLTERENCSKNQSEKLLDYASRGTLMFELIDSRFRIVIDYRKKNYPEGLYLIGYRDQLGRLWNYSEIGQLAAYLGLPCMKTYQFDSLDQLLGKTEELTVLEEGFVLRYPDGLMVKIKGMAYLKAHRFISQLSDKHILEAVAEGVADPLVEIAPEEYRDDVIEKIAYFKSRKLDLVDQCYKYFADAPKGTRKEFALWVNVNVKSSLKGCLFNLMDGKSLSDKQMYGIILETEDISVETRI
jgi:hypothetical protein